MPSQKKYLTNSDVNCHCFILIPDKNTGKELKALVLSVEIIALLALGSVGGIKPRNQWFEHVETM